MRKEEFRKTGKWEAGDALHRNREPLSRLVRHWVDFGHAECEVSGKRAVGGIWLAVRNKGL